jgi:hypothetical protein
MLEMLQSIDAANVFAGYRLGHDYPFDGRHAPPRCAAGDVRPFTTRRTRMADPGGFRVGPGELGVLSSVRLTKK